MENHITTLLANVRYSPVILMIFRQKDNIYITMLGWQGLIFIG